MYSTISTLNIFKLRSTLNIHVKVLMLIGQALSILMMSSYRRIGYFGFAITFLVAVACAKRMNIDKLFKASMLCVTVLLIRFLVQVSLGQWYINTIRSFLLQVFIYLYILLICNSKISVADWNWIFSKYALIVLVISFYLFMRNQLSYSPVFSSMFGNMVLIGFGIALIKTSIEKETNAKILWFVILVLFVFFTYKSDMRSAIMGELAGIAFSVYSSLNNEGKRFNSFTFWWVILICFSIPYIYLELYYPSTSLSKELSSWLQYNVLLFSGKRMFSGRNNLWPYIINSFDGHLFFGNGVGYNPGQILETTLSTHNLFLFLRLEQGFVGLLSFIVFLYVLWQNYYTQRANKTAFYVQGFMVSVLFQQTFSLGLIGGKGAFSIICWTILSAFSKIQSDEED